MGMVQIKLSMFGGGRDTTAFILPAGFSPSELVTFPVAGVGVAGADRPAQVTVRPNGFVDINYNIGGNNAIYAFISFPVDA